MHKAVRVALSLLLTLVIAAGSVLPCFAETGKTAFIVVSGMNTFPLYDSDNNKVYPLSSSSIAGLVAEILPSVTAYLVTRDANRLADKVLPALKELFDPIRCNDDGSSACDIHTDIFDNGLRGEEDNFSGKTKDEEGIVRAGIEKYGVDNTFFFNYDWRLDPLDHADRLNTFTGNVKAETGCSRVALAAFSMGGTVVCSYLYKYGSSDVDSIELCSTAFQGTSVVGDLFQKGKISLSLEGLIRRLGMLTRNSNLEELIDYINEGLTLNGFNTKVSDFADNLIEALGDRLYDELLIPIFGYMPGLWSLCDGESFDSCKEYMLRNGCDEKLISRLDEYHTNVQGKAEELLEKASSDTNIYIFAQYNMEGLPVSERCNESNNDYLIDCVYASGGATVSPLGETLGDGYTQKLHREYNYLSPDGQIDASTCMFPDRTWFIRDMGHVDYPEGDGADFVLYFADKDEQVTVGNSEYSQFLTYSYETGKLTATTGEKETGFSVKILGFLSKIRKFLYVIIFRIREIFN